MTDPDQAVNYLHRQATALVEAMERGIGVDGALQDMKSCLSSTIEAVNAIREKWRLEYGD